MPLTWPTWTDDDGSGTTGTILNNAQHALDASAIAAWTSDSYTPTWGNTGTANSIGDGSITGKKFVIGKLVLFQASVTFGSSTSVGNGTQTLSLPATLSAQGQWATEYINSGVAQYGGSLVSVLSSTVVGLLDGVQPAGAVTASNPFAFGNGDGVILSGWFIST